MSQRPSRPERRSIGTLRRATGAVCGAVLVLTAGLAGAAASPSEPGIPGGSSTADAARAKIRPAVAEELRRDGEATVLVRFAERPDLDAFAQIGSWEVRGQAVYDALVDAAESSQADARARLDAAGVDYERFVVSNALLVPAGDQELVTSLAADPQVEGVYVPARYDVPDQLTEESRFSPAAVGWNVADVNADDVWTRLGVDGDGIVVGSIDTGVDHTHPTLRDAYRGRNADGTLTHDHSWFDAAGTGAVAPTDGNGHGTHTTGTMVGDDGGSNQIGVAPGARWVAANGCCPSNAALIAAGEWMLAPTRRDGTDPRPELRPHVVNNSWGTTEPSTDPFMVDVAQAWAAAGMFAVFSNGNSGPGCTTSTTPGSLAQNYSVGAYGADHLVAPSSSRGAGEGGAVKPDVAAPGVGVRSAAPGGGYATGSGTSMAAPHVAGAVALLWSAVPDLVGDVPATRALLDGSAVDSPDAQCGGAPGNNNVYGEGRLDALALLTAAGVVVPEVARVAGTNRYETAARVADAFAPGTGTVFVASGAAFPDALAAAARAGSLGGPVLLTGAASLPQPTRVQMERLRPSTVVVAGGPGAVQDVVLDQIRALLPSATVTRRSGTDRYGTAASIAADVPSAATVMVANGLAFPDALAGAAAAGAQDAPLLLTQPSSLPQATRDQLDRLAPVDIVVLGGPNAVSASVEQELAAYGQVSRVAGTDRYGTAAALTADRTDTQDVYVATGVDWPDALAGAARAAATGSPVLLTRTSTLPVVTADAVGRLDPARVVVLGGTGVVTDAVLTDLRRPR